MASKQLLVLMNGRRLGTVTQTNNLLSLRYESSWQKATDAIPLSLSMPLSESTHEDPVVSAFMWGLLPDNEVTLSEWGKRHHVSPGNCFALLGAVGEDCPGAIQFVSAERLHELRSASGVSWLDQSGLEELIDGLRTNPGAGRTTITNGQFSLAGAQPKTALLKQGDRWGIPRGRTPTTHILKPATGDLDGIVDNEHFCLSLAVRVGLSAAETEIIRVHDVPVICSTRYDRQQNRSGEITRLHQEDLCQSLGVHPTRKYQNEGGPGAVEVMEAIRRFSSKADLDRDRFMRALAFNYAILGTDAHAKNYGFLILPRGRVRLAPLYDVGSYLPYAKGEKGIKLAMKIGDHYESDRIHSRHWEQLSAAAGFPSDRAIGHVRDLLARLPGEGLGLLYTCRNQGLSAPVLDRLLDELWRRVRFLASMYGTELLALEP